MKRLGFGLLLLALVAGVLWWSYGQRSTATLGAANAPLSYVPADTPYVLANIAPWPRAVLDKAMQQSAGMVDLYAELLANLRRDLAASDKATDKRSLALLDAVMDEFKGKTPLQVNETLGFDLSSRMALYGVGMVPVLRMELGKPDNFRAFMARLVQAGDGMIGTASLQNQPYWRWQPEKAPLQAIGAIIDGQLVISLAPSPADDAVLRTLFGLQRPAQSLQDSGALLALNKNLGFQPYLSGYVDSAGLLAALVGPGNVVEDAFLTALRIERPAVDEICKTEYAAIAAAWPRISLGYTRLDTEHNDSLMLIETRPDIAEELMKLRAPMPGLGKFSESAIMNFGLSFKLSALPTVAGKFAGDVAQSPWQCESLAPLNAMFAEARTQLNNPAVFAAAPVFSGLHAIVSSIDLDLQAASAKPNGSGVLLIGSDNPQSLIGMAKGFAPQLATLELGTDSKVHVVPALPGVPEQLQLFAASSDKVLGLAIGADAEQQLPALLEADPAQQPLLVMGFSARFYRMLADGMVEAAEKEADEDSKAELIKQAEIVRSVYATMFERMQSRIEFSPRGIEFVQTVSSQ